MLFGDLLLWNWSQALLQQRARNAAEVTAQDESTTPRLPTQLPLVRVHKASARLYILWLRKWMLTSVERNFSKMAAGPHMESSPITACLTSSTLSCAYCFLGHTWNKNDLDNALLRFFLQKSRNENFMAGLRVHLSQDIFDVTSVFHQLWQATSARQHFFSPCESVSGQSGLH